MSEVLEIPKNFNFKVTPVDPGSPLTTTSTSSGVELVATTPAPKSMNPNAPLQTQNPLNPVEFTAHVLPIPSK